MTVGELKHRMGYAEFLEWGALDEIRKEERAKAEREASKGMKARR